MEGRTVMEMLRFEAVSFTYREGEQRVLDQISFSMEKGEYLVVCGESGCGKTTLLRLIKREMTPQGIFRGKIFFNEIPLEKLDRETSALKIGFVQQNPDNQIVTDYVWHEMAFGLENMALPTQAIRRRVSEMAIFFGMEKWFHKKTCELSGGQKQMLNLASILVMNPEVLILDEPTSMLDPLAARSLLQMILRINRELGVSVLLSEHRLEDVFQNADQVLLLQNGKILFKGTPGRIASHLQKEPESSKIYYGLPGAVRIFGELQKMKIFPEEASLPLSIRDARKAFTKVEVNKAYEPEMRNGKKLVHDSGRKKEKLRVEPVLKTRELWFQYQIDGSEILRSLDISLYKGEFLGLLGGNGSGKSTLLKVIAGILKPQCGKIKIEEGLRIAMLPQNIQALFRYDTVWEEFIDSADGKKFWRNMEQQEDEIFRKNVSREGEDEIARMRAGRMARQLDLEDKLNVHPYDLSGGEMQRTAIGKLLLQGADILLLDEPTKGMDAYLKRTLAEYLTQLTKRGISILMVTHDLEFAASYTDRCAFLFDGQVISEEEPHLFFSENRFYTTSAGMIAGDRIPRAITCEEVIAGCRKKGK